MSHAAWLCIPPSRTFYPCCFFVILSSLSALTLPTVCLCMCLNVCQDVVVNPQEAGSVQSQHCAIKEKTNNTLKTTGTSLLLSIHHALRTSVSPSFSLCLFLSAVLRLLSHSCLCSCISCLSCHSPLYNSAELG